MTVDRVLFEPQAQGAEGAFAVSGASEGHCAAPRAAGVVVQDDKGKSWTIQLGSSPSSSSSSVEAPPGQQGEGRGHMQSLTQTRGRGQGDVVITNGSLGATGLLQRSGIGPRETLQQAGVAVVVDNPEVGHGVDHLEISLVNEWHQAQQAPKGQGQSQSQGVTRGGPTGWPLVLFADMDGMEQNSRRNVMKAFPMYRPNTYFQVKKEFIATLRFNCGYL